MNKGDRVEVDGQEVEVLSQPLAKDKTIYVGVPDEHGGWTQCRNVPREEVER